MGIRDLVVFALVFGGLPFIVRQPAIGIMYWAWLGLMNPHRQAWGLAFDFPFAQVVAGATLIGLVFTSEPRRFKGGGAAFVLVLFMVWTWLTTANALVPDAAWQMLDRVFKIQLFTLLALLALYKREHVVWLAAIMAISIGYYTVKGGVFTIATAGNYRVWGPEGSFVNENNALAVANVMTIPLFVFFYQIAKTRWVKWSLLACVLLSAVAVLGSHSRGALLAVSAMSALLWFKSKRKLVVGMFIAIVAAGLIALMPNKWEERMGTIATFEEDASARGRLDAWLMLYNLAVDRPAVGGGFEPYTNEVYARYNPGFEKPQVAHSVYFQVLGEHGFVGFFLWIMFWLLTWRMSCQVAARAGPETDDAWAYWLANMVQVSLVGYFVGGAFLNLAYWDMPYYLMVLMAVTRYALADRQQEEASPTRSLARSAQ